MNPCRAQRPHSWLYAHGSTDSFKNHSKKVARNRGGISWTDQLQQGRVVTFPGSSMSGYGKGYSVGLQNSSQLWCMYSNDLLMHKYKSRPTGAPWSLNPCLEALSTQGLCWCQWRFGSLQVLSQHRVCHFMHYALQHSAIPLCIFTWSATLYELLWLLITSTLQ